MSEPTPFTAPVVATPIQVNATPEQDQIEAGVRQLLLVVSAVATVLGYNQVAGEASQLLTVSGLLAGFIAFAWGQWKTRVLSKKAAAMANALPDSVAVAK